ncbi:MAG: diguanylate cyclase [Vampirovibrionales bacterium]|nr:diguanylate cyclase [Vampirovibrionales bacterium]
MSSFEAWEKAAKGSGPHHLASTKEQENGFNRWLQSKALPNQRIVLAYSDPKLLAEYQAVLNRVGFEVFPAKTAEDALQMVYRHFPIMVLGELQLPDLNGYQLCRLIKNDPLISCIPFILVSEFDVNVNRFWGFKCGSDGFIYKKESASNGLQEIKTVLELFDFTLRDNLPVFSENTRADLIGSATQSRLKQLLDKTLVESTLMQEFRVLSDLAQDISLMNHLLFSLLESVLAYDLAAVYFKAPGRSPQNLTFHIPRTEDVSLFPGEKNEKHTQRAISKTVCDTTLAQLQQFFFENIHHTDVRPISKGNHNFSRAFRSFELAPPEVIGSLQANNTRPETANELTSLNRSDFSTIYLHPFYRDNELIGGLALFSLESVQYEHIFPIKLVEQEIQRLVNQRYLVCQAETYYLSDPLTGAYNYRYFMAMLEKEFTRAQRYKTPLSLVIVNLDELKHYNDAHGYLLGDEIIRQVAHYANENFRTIDVVARISGKEFAVIMPETDPEKAHIACERFRQAIERNPVEWRDTKITATVSLGLASLKHHQETASVLLSRASNALFMAKKKGRNRIETALN